MDHRYLSWTGSTHFVGLPALAAASARGAVHLGGRGARLADAGLPRLAGHLVARVAKEAAGRGRRVVRVRKRLGVAAVRCRPGCCSGPGQSPGGDAGGGDGRGARAERGQGGQLAGDALGDADEAVGHRAADGVPAADQRPVAHLGVLLPVRAAKRTRQHVSLAASATEGKRG